MSKKLKLTALMALVILSGTVSAQVYHGFVKDPYYLIKGGKEVSPQDFAADPMRYMRSPTTYTVLREHVALVIGRPVDDAAFRKLIVSDDVKLVQCVGRLKTDGITDAGKVGRHERGCYPGERLMQVRVPGGWMNLLSLGCYNPIEGERPPPPKPVAATPVDGVCGPAFGSYAHNAMTFRGEFCSSGAATSFIVLPRPGQSATYTCFGTNGGKNATCPIRVEQVPTPTVASGPPPRVCRLVPVSLGTSSTQQFSSTPPGMLMQYCDDTKRWIPGVTSTIGGGEVSTGTLVEICEGGVAK